MAGFYLIYVLACFGAQFNDVYIFKRYQLENGASLRSNVMYLILNGFIYAGVSALALLFQREPIVFSWYSLLFAFGVVACAGTYMIILMKAYEWGQIATAMIFSSMGSIILTCSCGILLLGEALTVPKAVSILLMLLALMLITDRNGEKFNKKLIWMYLLIASCASGVTMLYKYHQISDPSLAVDTYSFSVWVGLMRVLVFSGFIPYFIRTQGRSSLRHTRKSFTCAVISAVIVAVTQIMSLISLAVLPVSVTSPLCTAITILVSVLVPWISYHERLNRKQIAGAVFSLIGALLFVVN